MYLLSRAQAAILEHGAEEIFRGNAGFKRFTGVIARDVPLYDVRLALIHFGDRFHEIVRGIAGDDCGVFFQLFLGQDRTIIVFLAISTAVLSAAGAQDIACTIRARIRVTVENWQVSGVTTAAKMITYGRGAAKTGAAAEAARKRREIWDVRIVNINNDWSFDNEMSGSSKTR